ncbi:uncharacterized protein [Panulirus ornatus]|uniref:uncharacterized protein isoform X2 n=1 Tax=Panulirus ornatus TaxID=150431 RepID=UPI003A89129D
MYECKACLFTSCPHVLHSHRSAQFQWSIYIDQDLLILHVSRRHCTEQEEKMESSEPNLRIPAALMPSYLKLISTEEGKTASKRVRVDCGICKETRYYSIHRGVTRVGGVVLACEACRHYYQKFKRQPCMLQCKEEGRCYVLGDNSKNRCKACWIAYILGRCPLPEDLYKHLSSHLPSKIKAALAPKPPSAEDIPENERGALGLEVMENDEWVDVTEIQKSEMALQTSEDEEDSRTYEQEFNAALEGEKYLGQYETIQWWMEHEEGSAYKFAESDNNQSYFNMDGMHTADGLTSLTPLQPADGLTTLTPLQVPSDHHHQNGFHDSEITLLGIKQEKKFDWQDGESQEAQLFQNISVKQEYYPQHEEVDLHVHSSPYFSHADMDSHQNVDMLSQEHSVIIGSSNWKVEAHPLDAIDKNLFQQENIEVPKLKKRGWKSKIKVEEDEADSTGKSATETTKRSAPEIGPDGKPLPSPLKQRKKVDRFNGIPEEEVVKKTLPDHLGPNMDILIIGINPGLTAAHKGHHYAGPGNHFWKCMYLSGLIPEPFTAYDDFRLLQYGIGFTNIVARTTRGSSDLTKEEIKKGGEILHSKVKKYKPLIAVFNGKGIYEIYSGKKQFSFGKQPEMIEGTNTHIWVMPSSSARCAQLPRALDKVPFYSALRKYRDYLKGMTAELDDEEVVFSHVKLTNYKSPAKQEPKSEPNKEMIPETIKRTQRKLGREQTKGQRSPHKKKNIISMKTEKGS